MLPGHTHSDSCRLDISIGKHLDEVFVKINGEQRYLWRAVDQDGNVLDILVQSRRDKAAARRFFRRLMKKTRTVPRVVVTDKLRSTARPTARSCPPTSTVSRST